VEGRYEYGARAVLVLRSTFLSRGERDDLCVGHTRQAAPSGLDIWAVGRSLVGSRVHVVEGALVKVSGNAYLVDRFELGVSGTLEHARAMYAAAMERGPLEEGP
jgi:hypothetical protein